MVNEGQPVSHYSDIGVININPALTSNLPLTIKMFRGFVDAGAKAIVLDAYATGTTPEVLNPLIAEFAKEKGVPVFVVSRNPGDKHGIQRIVYTVQEEAQNAGATPLRDVNINDADAILSAIQTAIDKGFTGEKLVEEITFQFGTPAHK